MCGVVGVCEFSGEAVPIGLLRKMTDSIAHRGPDGEGHYAEGCVGLGNRRLAIIDLSAAGHQPMANADGTVVLVYNGEIYNFPQLRVQLEAMGYQFRSRTDTEVLLHAYEAWGEAAIERLNGHFAFGLWDRKAKRLVLARDRFGVKPLYYWNDGQRFVFASEIKAILAYPAFTVRLSKPALNEYFAFQNILSDRTLFEGIRLLPPGTSMTVDAASGEVRTHEYWDFRFRPEPMTLPDAIERVYDAFDQAVTRQLVSDVPVGSYLSGGVDSSSITAVATKKLGRIWTFTCGFDLSSASGLEIAFDERPYAEAMSNYLQTEHYQTVLHAGDMQYVLRDLVWHLEDLRVGQSYPNYYVARLGSRFVKVVLSGVGGDELFGGYPWRYRSAFAGDGGFLRSYFDYWQRLIRDENKPAFFNHETWSEVGEESLFELFSSVIRRSGIDTDNPAAGIDASLYFELKTFLAGLLIVEDKLSMTHSLEARAPFLDNDLVELAMRIPVEHKVRALGTDDPTAGKFVLREAMRRLVPAVAVERPKQGFSAPDASWFRGGSIDFVRQKLLARHARLCEFIRPEAVAAIVDEHCSGKVNHRLLIWSLLSFETWCDVFLS